MNYKKFGHSIYARLDKNEDIVKSIIAICKAEKVVSATYTGIGGCDDVTVSTYVLEKKEHLPERKTGLFEMISLTGSITFEENGDLFSHAHALFSYLNDEGKIEYLGGHLLKANISLTGEIVITPVEKGVIRRMKDPITDLYVWSLGE